MKYKFLLLSCLAGMTLFSAEISVGQLKCLSCTVAKDGNITVNPGEKTGWQMPEFQIESGKRVILSLVARVPRPLRIADQYIMNLELNGKTVDPEIAPENSGIPRLVNRTAKTLHGTSFAYFKNGAWNVVSNPREDYVEIVYTPEDYYQVYYYRFDVTDLVSGKGDKLVIRNTAKSDMPLLIRGCNIALADADALPHQPGRSFTAIRTLPVQRLKTDAKEVTLELPALPIHKNMHRILRFRARLDIGRGTGSNTDLYFRFNGKKLGQVLKNRTPRLINRDTSRFFGRNLSALRLTGDITTLHLANSFALPDAKNFPTVDANEIAQGCWYYLLIDDAAHADKANTVTLRNLASGKNFGKGSGKPELVVDSFGIGYITETALNNSYALSVPSRKPEKCTMHSCGNYKVGITAKGGIQFEFGKKILFLESRFGRPGGNWNPWLCQGAPAFNSEKSWKVQIKAEKDGFAVISHGSQYQVSRRVICKKDVVKVHDTFTNIAEKDTGIRVQYQGILSVKADKVLTNGSSQSQSSRDMPSANSTVFWAMKSGSVGIAVADDFLKLQGTYKSTPQSTVFGSEHFGLAPGKSYTMEYEIYPVPGNDYFDFINQVRNEWGINNRYIPAPFMWSVGGLNAQQRELYADCLGAGLTGVGSWYSLDRAQDPDTYTIADAARPSLKANAMWKSTLKGKIRTFPFFQGTMTWRNKKGVRDPLADSVIIEKNGKLRRYNPNYRRAYPGEFHVCRYFTLTNSYFKYAMDSVKYLMDHGFDGIYFDTPNSSNYHYGRFTYDRWDGLTVDLAPDNSIVRKYADLCILTGPARAKMAQYILDRNGFIIYNSPNYLRQILQIPGQFICFCEGDTEYRLGKMHLCTPIQLGEHYLRNDRQAPSYGRRKTWKTEEDFMDDMRWKLQNGLLYYPYMPPLADPKERVSSIVMRHEWPTKYMFPITVTDIHAGWVRGKERIVTNLTGEYSWQEPCQNAELRLFDVKGRPLPVVQLKADNAGKFHVTVPENGMAVLIRR